MNLSRDDRSYFVLESPETPMHLCVLATLEAAVSLGALRADLSRRLPAIMRQRLDGRTWVDDARFDITEHVFAAPAERVEQRVSELLDRSKPLWTITLLEGGERPALLIKLHHAVADGIAAVALLAELFGAPISTPSSSAAPAASPPPARASLGGFPRLAPRSSLNQPVRAGRRFCWAKLDLDAARARAHQAGGHLNDVLLDVVAAALRPLLRARGELAPGLVLRATVPVSLRAPGDGRALGNQVGGMLVDLPVGEDDPNRRLEAIVASTRRAKNEQRASLLPELIGRVARFSGWLFRHQRWVNVFVTNVPGPRSAVHVAGSRIVDLVPLALPAGNVGIAFAALSYAGNFYVSATVDASRFPDFEVLASALTAAAVGPGAERKGPARFREPGLLRFNL